MSRRLALSLLISCISFSQSQELSALEPRHVAGCASVLLLVSTLTFCRSTCESDHPMTRAPYRPDAQGKWPEFDLSMSAWVKDWHLISDTQDVQRPDTRFRTGGLLMGRPLRSRPSTGTFFKTKELEINWGQPTDDSNYIGTSLDLSTTIADTFSIFQQIENEDSKRAYIFRYEQPMGINWEIEDSHYQLLDIRPTLPAGDFFKSGLPLSVKSHDVGKGPSEQGSSVTGRIIAVDRVGHLSQFGALYLLVGGLKTNAESGENTLTFRFYGEKAVRWAELVMHYDLEVRVDYSKDMVEIWHEHERIAHEITVKQPELISNPTIQYSRLSREELEAIKKSLLSDPLFLEQLRNQLNPEGPPR